MDNKKKVKWTGFFDFFSQSQSQQRSARFFALYVYACNKLYAYGEEKSLLALPNFTAPLQFTVQV